ncbi:hypothetical protein A9Q84_05510 [Halobacteriovorax marinus]|uniref:Peptidase n=1 Tax=Halobacteriovorax marinus TaxID=97084 RepID=A0A1Y5FAZ7_9BACT|nr:hypothetical protein A9Q84_05510 [Halobacteriovorax marinus]
MEVTKYNHNFAAHCETGVTSSLFENKGMELSEAMSLGIGSGLFFLYVPFIKVMGNPITSYRSFPGTIFKKCCKRLKVKFRAERFRNSIKGSKRLDQLLKNKVVLGIQTNIYWLSYIPKNFRFHFNAHNLIVVKKEEDGYLVSDPLLEEVSHCSESSMTKARFSKGPLAPKGLVYYIDGENSISQVEQAVYQGIKETVRRMLYSPVPIVGIAGMKLLSRSIRKWPKKLDERRARLYLSNVIRMQEEIGTGGAGFRYIYAGFLNESSKKLNNPILLEASEMMEAIADEWRVFATMAVKVCKNKGSVTFDQVADKLLEIAEQEKSFYQFLNKRYL